MDKIYLEKNVYKATQERLKTVFEEFENIYVSFSGGKDSGLLLNLCIDYMKKNNITKKLGVFHQDFEAQYEKTTEYVTKMFELHKEFIEPYWVCMPMAVRNALGNDMFWYPWETEKKDIWVRPMPNFDYVINIENQNFSFYKEKMNQEDLYKQFGKWYKESHGNGKTIALIGVRADESLHRYSGIVNKKYKYKDENWITTNFKDVWSASPIYDWTTKDVWVANAKFGYDYNKIYDLYYQAGLTIDQMRVASPFNDYAVEGLNMYRVIEPQTWTKLVGRVNGANFGAIYGGTKAMGYREITLPEGHSWKSYTEFLLQTLPRELRENYIEKFKFSEKFWKNTGGGFSEEVISEIEEKGYKIKKNGVSNFTKDGKSRIVFEQDIPDNTDDVRGTNDIPSWKRMCYCILKNDHLCKFMGFGLNKNQQARVNEIKAKYKNL